MATYNYINKIMLDAGHYGKQNRSPVVPEYWESEMTWKLQNYLKPALERYGFVVGTTRTEQGKDLEVYQRGKKAKGYDLFVSLHSNACGSEAVDHVSGIYLVSDNRTNVDEISKDFAIRISAGVAEFMPVKDGAKCYSRLGTGDRDGNGKADDNYYGVLHGARTVNVPGIIIEHSFHTNTAATKWLLQDANLKAMAKYEAALLAEMCGKSRIKGDANGDGVVNSIDALKIKKAILGTITLTDDEKAAADVNSDGRVNSLDFFIVKKIILGTYKQ